MSDRKTFAWAAPYAGLDDDALEALGNPGLLRRARKDTVTEVSHDPKGAVLDVSGAMVRVDGRGPAAVSCDCPTAGVCQHVLTACLWAVQLAPDAPPQGAVPVVAQAVPKTSGAAGTRETSAASGMREPSVVRRPSEAVRKRRREALAEVREVVGRLMSGGLSHLGPDDAESLRALAGRVRLAGFQQVATEQVGGVRFDGLLRVAGGLVAGLAGRDDAVTESELLDAFAEAWAMCEVLQRALDTDGTAHSALGSAPASDNADDDEVDLARWVPLGARWWTSQSGSRGLAYLGWDAGSGQVRQVVTGRPSGTDPRFQRSWTSPLLWGRSLSGLCEGVFALTAVRSKPDGSLGAGGNPVLRRLDDGSDGVGFGLDELRAIAERTGAGVAPRDVVGFGRRPANVRLVLVRDVGEVGIDEVRQEMTLVVVTADGEPRMLRLPVSDEQAVETLLSVRSKLVAVTIERREDRDEPVGLFVRDKGAIRLISPTITPAWSLEGGYWDFWRRRMRKLKAQASSARTVRSAATPPSPVRRVTLLLGDVLLAAAATGRPALTARQRSDVERARGLARDLGLATLERTAGGLLAGDLTPPSVLHAAFVVGRARAVADVAG
ncbi:hypothetical protein [Promicromonospora soli]|uniref:SWIM zinc finger protein n=1 Tax=Promicromonospora soli TaxID=2035533 RepID=A0A919FI92_9MICO|nr:hypothetical protein [Promicromonospora soli]GHH66328.1 hypothetical protein GCM10017772_06100 [Promicromonospora soli]